MKPHFQRALLLYQQSRLQQAEQEVRQALAADPSAAEAHALLAMCLTDQQRRDEAENEARAAVHHGPDMSFAHFSLAYVLYDRNKYKQALVAIQEAIRLDPFDAKHYGQLSAIKFDQRDWQVALDAAEQGLAVDPDDVSCNNMRSMALVKLGRKTDAQQTLESVLAKEPENALTHANRGWTLLDAGDHRRAMESFREALRLDPSNEWARHGIVEAMKARNVLYRWMLKYFLSMSKLSIRAQWMIILGLFVLARMLPRIGEAYPAFEPFVLPLTFLYVAFVVMSWIASPLFNAVLLTSRFGRHALTTRERWVGGCVGSLFALGALWLVYGFAVDNAWCLLLGGYLGLMSIPVASVFRCASGRPRQLIASYAIALGLLGAGTLVLMLLELSISVRLTQIWVFAFFFFTIVANVAGASRPVR